MKFVIKDIYPRLQEDPPPHPKAYKGTYQLCLKKTDYREERVTTEKCWYIDIDNMTELLELDVENGVAVVPSYYEDYCSIKKYDAVYAIQLDPVDAWCD